MLRKLLLFTIAASAIAYSAPSIAETPRELLLFQDIPTVFTVSKREQPVTDSPSAVSIITAEDIKASGVTNIPDALRMVGGVDVMAISASDVNINIRGFNKDMSHKLLVLIDGRSVYLDFTGIVLWESLPINLEEIERIEVVKGPGSAVWGANAYSGIINIVTKSPKTIKGNTASLTVGELNTSIGSIVHAGRVKDTSYRLSAGWKEANNWSENNWGGNKERDENDMAMEVKRGNFTVVKDLDLKSNITISGGAVNGTGEVLSAMDVFKRNSTDSYLKVDYERDWLSFRGYWNNLRTNIDGMTTDYQTHIDRQ